MTWCWIIPIIVGLISALLGYLLGRAGKQREIDEWMTKYNEEKERLAECGRKVSLLENDLANAKKSEHNANHSYNELVGRFELLQHEWDENRTEIQNLKDENASLMGRLRNTEADAKNADTKGKADPIVADSGTADEGTSAPIHFAGGVPELVFDAAAARAVFGRTVKQDDLTIVEGIGPKIQELFHDQDVHTWYQLSQCSVERCEEILGTGGDRFRQHTPTTWPRQARLAFDGKWEELKTWQDELDGGV